MDAARAANVGVTMHELLKPASIGIVYFASGREEK